jgi:beta-lactamase class A
MRAEATQRIRAVFAAHGVRGTLHAVDVDGGDEIVVDANVPMPLASVYKVALATAVWRAADRGELDLREPVEVGDRTRGPTGLGVMLDPARLTVRDLAYLMLALSDNGAADVLLERVGGLDAVNAVHEQLGMTRTRARHAAADFGASLVTDTGTADAAAASTALAADPALLARLSVRDPARTNGGPARDQTRLLAALWRDRAASAEACAALRRILRLQVWPHRLAAGFPDPGMTMAGKTGTAPGVRNEVGVVEGPDGRTVALAVLTMADTPAASMPHLDALIGTTARIAYDALADG